jgi:hypothetical protein
MVARETVNTSARSAMVYSPVPGTVRLVERSPGERHKRPPGDPPYEGRHQRRRSQEAVARSGNPFGGLLKDL